MARRRFFVDAVRSGRAQIQGPDAHHLVRVLRVEPGQQFEISDNENIYLAEVESARKDLITFVTRARLEPAEPAVRTTLLASLIRFERFEWIIEKATELGVEQIVPVEAERSEKGLRNAAEKRLERWARISKEASEQSRRARLPELSAAVPLSDALAAEGDYKYLLEEGQAPPMLSILPATRSPADRVVLLLGPEGGWTDRERAAIASAGWCPVSLGPQILRAETAAVAALAIVNAHWSAESK